MHIEPGFITPAKVMLANLSVAGLLGLHVRGLITRPADIVRILLASLFFSLFMEGFHMNVGPSELHFIGAMAMYLTLGFLPTLFGFALGLFWQGVLFEPQDLPHLAVNSLSLMVPLVAVHVTSGRRLIEQGTRITWQAILKLDTMYYSGVALMVGFWLSISEVTTSWSAWALWASSYSVVVICEPLFTYATLRLLQRHGNNPLVELCFAVKPLNLARQD